MNKHSVFVLDIDGKPLTPTTPCRARKMVRDKVAKGIWSKFNTWGIQMLIPVGDKTPTTSLGVDGGTKFEGYSVVVGNENPINVKLDLPDKKKVVRKLDERRTLRRARRFRNCRRRPARFKNRSRKGFIAPSQLVIVTSRLKVIRELFKVYPIDRVGFEDVCFNHAKKRWGKNFSTIEIGKQILKDYFQSKGSIRTDFKGHETQEIRKKYGYRKTSVKNTDKFTAHCSDSLTLALAVNGDKFIEPGLFLVVNDTYRPVRRKLHDTQPAKGGVRDKFTKGTVHGLRKGLLIMTKSGKVGRLTGDYKGGYRFVDSEGKRNQTTKLVWISSNFCIKKGARND